MTYQAAHVSQFHDANGKPWPKSFGKDFNNANCWAAAAAMAADFATRGAYKPGPNVIRDESGDNSGGANRGDAARVLKAHGIIALTPYGVTWAQVTARLDTGRWGVWLAVDYDMIPDAKSCAPNFNGNHALWLPPVPADQMGRRSADDPLCDRQKWYPELTLRNAAEKIANQVGSGLLVVFVKQIPEPKPVPPPPPTDPKDKAIADLTAQVASLSQIVADLTDVNADLVAKLDAVKAAIA